MRCIALHCVAFGRSKRLGVSPRATVLYVASMPRLGGRGEERVLAEERTEQVIAAMGLPDMAVQSDELPWVPQGERVWFKPLRFDLATGRWINLLRVEGGGKVNRHRHTLVVDSGYMETLFILEGSIQYIDDDDNLIYQDDVFSKLERYLKFCEDQDIE